MKFYCNDQEVTEEVYLKVVEDHQQWSDDLFKKQQEAQKAALKPEKKPRIPKK